MTKVTAIDIETTGLNPWKDQITVIGTYDGSTYESLALRAINPNTDIVGHNTSFDVRFLRAKGMFPAEFPHTIHDTRIMAHLLHNKVPKEFLDWYEEERKRRNKELPRGQTYRATSALSLKVLAPWYLKVEPFWEKPGNYSDLEYNRKDCEYTYRLFHLFEEKLREEGSWDFYTKRMLEWQKMIVEMELRGIALDLKELDLVEGEYCAKRELLQAKLDDQWSTAHEEYYRIQCAELNQKYQEMAESQVQKGKDVYKTYLRYQKLMLDARERVATKINYSSPDQMTWLLKDHLGLDITDPEGEETTGKSVLHRLAQERDDIKNLLEFKEADKVLTMYLPTYRDLQIDGVIHPEFNITGTRTGRTSSSNPNMQQVPSKLYRLFKPRPGYSLIDYDLSGIEAALIALYSGDKQLFDILSKGESLHDHNVRAAFGFDDDISVIASKYPKHRKTVKNIGFALFYGAGWRRVQTVFAQGGFPRTEKESKEIYKRIKSYYPTAFEYHKQITEIFESGEVVHNLFNRPIKMQPHENAFMQGFNTLIQSSASDLNLRACEKATKSWREQGIDAHPLLVIHDCIVAESKTEISKKAEQVLVDAMCNFKLESINGQIPLKVEGKISDRWTK